MYTRAVFAATLVAAGSSHAANGLQVLYGTVMRTLADISGTVTSPVGDILVGTAQIAGTRLANTVIRIQGRYVTIPRGKQYWKEESEGIFYTRTTDAGPAPRSWRLCDGRHVRGDRRCRGSSAP